MMMMMIITITTTTIIIIIIIMMDIFCIALFFIRNQLTALYTFTQHLMMMMVFTSIAQALHAIVACSVRSIG